MSTGVLPNIFSVGLLTRYARFDDESESEEGEEHAFQFLEAGKGAGAADEVVETTLDFTAFHVQCAIARPGYA